MLHQNASGAQRVDRRHIVAYKHDRPPLASDIAHFSQAFLLEGGIAYGEYFVNEKDFGLEVGGDSEGEAHLHAAAVMLQGGVEEAFHFREGYDLVELAADFCGAHAEDGAAHEDVFASGEFGVETGADFEKAADAAVKFGVSFGGAGDAGEDFKERALAGAVAADQADHFAFFYVEGDVLQRPDVGRAAAASLVNVNALVAVRARAAIRGGSRIRASPEKTSRSA
jgi:hypothetical protein